MGVMKNKYIVYIDSDFIRMMSFQLGCRGTVQDQYDVVKQTIDNVNKFLSGDDSRNVIFSSTFIGTDGKRHYGIDIKAVPGFGKHPGRVLRKIKKLRK